MRHSTGGVWSAVVRAGFSTMHFLLGRHKAVNFRNRQILSIEFLEKIVLGLYHLVSFVVANGHMPIM